MSTKIKSSLPIILTQNLSQSLASWQNTLKGAVQLPSAPPTPLNFTVTNAQGGLHLNWAPVVKPTVKGQVGQTASGPDGYEILRSPSGTFTTDLTIIKVPNNAANTYFDSTGGTAMKITYRIYATAGTPSNPQSVSGPISGTITHTSLLPTDTTTTPTTVRDRYTTDQTRSTARAGNYGVKQYQFFPGVK